MNANFLIALAKYGIGSVIAVYLVWQMGESLPSIEKEVLSIGVQGIASEKQHQDISIKLQRAEERKDRVDETMIRLMRGTCMGLHKTLESQQQFCNL